MSSIPPPAASPLARRGAGVRPAQANTPASVAARQGCGAAAGVALGAASRRRPGRSCRLAPRAASITESFGVQDWPAVQQLLQAASAGDLGRLRDVLCVRPDLAAARTWLPEGDVASGYTPLHFAAAAGSTRCVEALLTAGASVAARDDRRATPLHWAAASASALGAEGANTPCIRALLEAGADIDARDEDGETALHAAARLGNLVAIRCLAEAGAYLGAASLEGATPQIIARDGCKWEAAVLLGQLQAEVDGLMVESGAPEAECVNGMWLRYTRNAAVRPDDAGGEQPSAP